MPKNEAHHIPDWREQDVRLNPGLQVVYFDDTKPNHIHINNLGAATLYVSAKTTPDPLKYDVTVKPYDAKLFARQIQQNRVMIYVDGTDPCLIRLTSFTKELNPASLQSGVTISQDGSTGGGTDGYVSISGFNVPLPSGSNNIGKVTISELPVLKEGFNHIGNVTVVTLPSLPSGNNDIGNVGVNSLPSLPTGSNQIGRVLVDNDININSMPPVEVSSEPTRSSHFAYENTISTTAVTWDLTQGGTVQNDMVEINYISNDGDTDLFISFDDDTISTTPGQGINGVIRLKAGEAIDGLNRLTTKLNFVRASGSGTVRVLGV